MGDVSLPIFVDGPLASFRRQLPQYPFSGRTIAFVNSESIPHIIVLGFVTLCGLICGLTLGICATEGDVLFCGRDLQAFGSYGGERRPHMASRSSCCHINPLPNRPLGQMYSTSSHFRWLFYSVPNIAATLNTSEKSAPGVVFLDILPQKCQWKDSSLTVGPRCLGVWGLVRAVVEEDTSWCKFVVERRRRHSVYSWHALDSRHSA